jgi:hypothetical protein
MAEKPQLSLLPGVTRTATKLPVLPLDDVPQGERWLYENDDASASFARGIEDARHGRTTRMSFAEYADIKIDD